MKIISLNIGEPKNVFWNKKAYTTSFFKKPVNTKVKVTQDGIVGDKQANTKFHGGVNKAVYAYSADNYLYWKELLGLESMEWGMFGENITINGIDERDVCIGDIFQTGSVQLMAVQPRQPCSKLSMRFNNLTMVKKFWDADKPGIYFKVIKNGEMKTGNTFELIEKSETGITIFNIYRILNGKQKDTDLMKRIISISFIPDSLKKDIYKVISH
ncbi:MAG: MOSC domain-containing protein [Chlorobi bacterium]|nr:MOSC domain-containing protein [Chlorobiota bacterium]